MATDHPTFFASIRKSLFAGRLPRDAVEDIEAIFGAWSRYGDVDERKLAYVIATAYHESDRFKTMEEYASGAAYEGRRDLGNTHKGDGRRFKGRGYVQLTGRRNYADWASRADLPLVEQPQLVVQREVAARILVQGMMLGTFTGRKLGTYVTKAKADFTNARRVVNGTDRAATIAGYARSFLVALREAVVVSAKPPLAEPERRPVEPQVTPTLWWERLLGVRAPVIALVGKNRGDEVLFRQQNRLLAAGYTEVGDPDGLWGPNTRTAVTLALEEQAPSVTPPKVWPVSDEVLATLAKLRRREVAAERADVTISELRARGSTPIKAPVQLVGGGGLLGLLGLGKAIQETGIPEKLTEVSDQAGEIMGSIQTAISLVGAVFTFLFTYWWIVLPVLAVWFLILPGVKYALEIRALVRQGSIRQTRL